MNMKHIKVVCIIFLSVFFISCMKIPKERINALDKNNKKQGLWIICAADSTSVVNFKEDKKNGIYRVYDKEGYLIKTGNFKNDIQLGRWKFYYKGRLVSVIIYKKNGDKNIKFIRNLDL